MNDVNAVEAGVWRDQRKDGVRAPKTVSSRERDLGARRDGLRMADVPGQPTRRRIDAALRGQRHTSVKSASFGLNVSDARLAARASFSVALDVTITQVGGVAVADEPKRALAEREHVAPLRMPTRKRPATVIAGRHSSWPLPQ